MELLLEVCLRVAGKRGLSLFFALVIGVPALVVAWGYATGRLPAPSPYVD